MATIMNNIPSSFPIHQLLLNGNQLTKVPKNINTFNGLNILNLEFNAIATFSSNDLFQCKSEILLYHCLIVKLNDFSYIS